MAGTEGYEAGILASSQPGVYGPLLAYELPEFGEYGAPYTPLVPSEAPQSTPLFMPELTLAASKWLGANHRSSRQGESPKRPKRLEVRDIYI